MSGNIAQLSQGQPSQMPAMLGSLAQALSQAQAYRKQKGAGVAGLGPQGKIPGANPAATAATGYNAAQASKDIIAPGNEFGGIASAYNQMRQPVYGSTTSSEYMRGLDRLISGANGTRFG